MACPESIDRYAQWMLVKDMALQAKVEAALRERLEKETDPEEQGLQLSVESGVSHASSAGVPGGAAGGGRGCEAAGNDRGAS